MAKLRPRKRDDSRVSKLFRSGAETRKQILRVSNLIFFEAYFLTVVQNVNGRDMSSSMKMLSMWY